MKAFGRRLVLSAVFAACIPGAGSIVAARGSAPTSVEPASAPEARSFLAPADGRYKKVGNACVWAPNDSGPNQCTPLTEGRFKRERGACVWDAAGRGRNQCRPATGRFKRDDDKCVWNPTDTGPNQCNPRQPK